ncbi:MAG: aspartate--tRNA ligase [Hyphomicrobiaceae bacterium]|nr:aspartate--tRNA ligase [Hyphomicrobiaceae bacterium]
MNRYRSHTCGALRTNDVDQIIRISGWVHRVRDHGGVLFIDLRDHYGLTQVVVDPESGAFVIAETVRSEWIIRVDGQVRMRPDGTVNPELPTGEVEVFASEIIIISAAKELPLPVFAEPDYPEDLRLQYRFLDLRRDTLHANIMRRIDIIKYIRDSMNSAGFSEFTTPILTASSPEGARDFLVPSRVNRGKFYALPQSPQQYKQLIMVSGFDRYFQIAPCFRDEDPRADRLPGEFYQLDVEMSFVEQENIFATMEPILHSTFKTFSEGKPVTEKIPRITYNTALAKYGSDKPDLRNPIEMQEVTEHFRDSGFKIFANMIKEDKENKVWAIPAPTGGSRSFCDRMNNWAQGQDQPGLGYIFWRNNQGAGPISKNIGLERTNAIRLQLDLKDGDSVFFVAGKPNNFIKFAGEARDQIGEELGLIDKNRFELAWIIDFPMYEWNEDDSKIDFSHNPFSMPQGGLQALKNAEKLGRLTEVKAYQYDFICNGYEIASGAIRNHLPDVMVKAFSIAGYSENTLIERFGGMYSAFQFGAPPHGGLAAGIDRIVMLLTGSKNLREVSLFPMNQQANDLLMLAPNEVTKSQLRELGIKIQSIPNP